MGSVKGQWGDAPGQFRNMNEFVQT